MPVRFGLSDRLFIAVEAAAPAATVGSELRRERDVPSRFCGGGGVAP